METIPSSALKLLRKINRHVELAQKEVKECRLTGIDPFEIRALQHKRFKQFSILVENLYDEVFILNREL